MLYEMSFELKFPSLTVKFGQNKNKINNINIIINLITELNSYLKKYPKRKLSRGLLHNTRINAKFRKERTYPRYRP